RRAEPGGPGRRVPGVRARDPAGRQAGGAGVHDAAVAALPGTVPGVLPPCSSTDRTTREPPWQRLYVPAGVGAAVSGAGGTGPPHGACGVRRRPVGRYDGRHRGRAPRHTTELSVSGRRSRMQLPNTTPNTIP